MAGFLGMRGTGDWVTDQMPYNWREAILYLYPNGMAPLTAIISKMGSKVLSSVRAYWWEQGLPTQEATVTGVYTNVALSNSYVSGAVAGSVLYFKCAEDDTKDFRVGHQVMANSSTYPVLLLNGEVVAVVKNGASSYIAVKCYEADDNDATPHYMTTANCNSLLIIGNVNAQGAARPPAIAYDPSSRYNVPQIWRNSLSMTGTAMQTDLRTGDAYKKAKRECLEMHSIEMEKSVIWSTLYEGVGDNGKPKNSMMGIMPFIRQYASANIFNYQTDSDFHGQTWLVGGETWLDKTLEVLFRYGSQERLGFCGSGALLGLQKLVKHIGNFEFTPSTKDYGIQVVTWTTPFGVVHLKTHPLFSYRAANRNMILWLEPKNLLWRPYKGRDTHFIPAGNAVAAGEIGLDGIEEEYLTEGTMEYHHAVTFGVSYGVGLDHTT